MRSNIGIILTNSTKNCIKKNNKTIKSNYINENKLVTIKIASSKKQQQKIK